MLPDWANEIIRKGFSDQTEMSLYNGDVIAVCANEIGALQISNRYNYSTVPVMRNSHGLVLAGRQNITPVDFMQLLRD